MRKALVCSALQFRLYVRSGRIALPLLFLLGYLAVFYHVLPVDVVSSFAISAIAAFVWGVWIAVGENWSEEQVLRQVLSVKVGEMRYFLAQGWTLALAGAAGGVFLISLPMLAHIAMPAVFVREPLASEVLLGILLNACAGVSGSALGAACHPQLIRDRKAAYLLCLLACVLGLVGGMAGIPLPLRALLPPLYDTSVALGVLDRFTANAALPASLWHIAYAAAYMLARAAILSRRGE